MFPREINDMNMMQPNMDMMQPTMNMMQPNVSQCMPRVMLLAHAYVPFQCMTCIYPPMKGLKQGTIFPELDRPYGVDPEYTIDA